MSVRAIEADYLVIGAGAMGMAFVDQILAESPDAQIVLIDRHARPGGHWNDAYPFVSLHQPAAYYGVNSEPLGRGGAALASGAEVLAYYERVLRRLLSTGRLQYFPLCEAREGGAFRSLVEPDEEVSVTVRKSVVDATYMNVQVPSTTPPRYEVDPEVSLVPPNALPELREPHAEYVVIGGGKTGMDAALFLLANGVDPGRMTWIVPHDAWLLDRAHIQPGRMMESGAGLQVESLAAVDSLEALLQLLDAKKRLLRIDEGVWPEKYRCATVSLDELAQLRRIAKVVRLGRVVRVGPGEIVLEQGSLSTDPTALHVDCTADGLARRPVRPVFEPAAIRLQSLFMCQQVFTASVIGHIECREVDLATKNSLCRVVPHPEFSRDYVLALALSMANMNDWGREFGRWLRKSRLCFVHHESTLDLLRAGIRGRRFLGDATEGLRKIFEQEFPGRNFPLEDSAASRSSRG